MLCTIDIAICSNSKRIPAMIFWYFILSQIYLHLEEWKMSTKNWALGFRYCIYSLQLKVSLFLYIYIYYICIQMKDTCPGLHGTSYNFILFGSCSVWEYCNSKLLHSNYARIVAVPFKKTQPVGQSNIDVQIRIIISKTNWQIYLACYGCLLEQQGSLTNNRQILYINQPTNWRVKVSDLPGYRPVLQDVI